MFNVTDWIPSLLKVFDSRVAGAQQANVVPTWGKTAGYCLSRRAQPLVQDAVLKCTCGPTAMTSALMTARPAVTNYIINEEFATNFATSSFKAENPALANLPPYFQWNNVKALANVARGVGVRAQDMQPGAAGVGTVLASALQNQMPVVAHLLLDGHSMEEGHFVTIDGIDQFGVHYMDPWPSNPRYGFSSWPQFMKQFCNTLNPNGLLIAVGP